MSAEKSDVADINVRPSEPTDLKTIQDLNHELFIYENEFHHDMNVDWPYEPESVKYFESCMKDADKLSIVAEVAGVIVGYLNAYIKKPHRAYPARYAELDNICVTKSYRGQGIGSELMREFKRWAKSNAVDKIVVQAISSNDTAIAFYKKNGFLEHEVQLQSDL